MIDYSKSPLTDSQIVILAKLRVPLYHDKDTGQTYVKRDYWNGVSEDVRSALGRAIL